MAEGLKIRAPGVTAALCALAIAACSTIDPTTDEQYRSANRQLEAARADPLVSRYAQVPLNDAAGTLQRASKAENMGDLHHLAYLARKKVEIARTVAQAREAEARLKAAQDDLAAAREEREKLRLEAQAAPVVEQIPLAEPTSLSGIGAAISAAGPVDADPQTGSETTERVDAAAAAAVAAAIAHADTVAVLSLAARMPGFAIRDEPQGIVITLPATSFPSGETGLSSDVAGDLRPLINYLKEHPQRTVVVKGYTDDTGESSYNIRVSNQRAESVKDRLVENGIDETRILTIGYGENQPIANNNTEEGRRANRRVEIVLVSGRDRINTAGEDTAIQPASKAAPETSTR